MFHSTISKVSQGFHNKGFFISHMTHPALLALGIVLICAACGGDFDHGHITDDANRGPGHAGAHRRHGAPGLGGPDNSVVPKITVIVGGSFRRRQYTQCAARRTILDLSLPGRMRAMR